MSALPGVASPEIGGVVMGRSVMQHEASRSLGIARRIGKRLMHWLSITQHHTQPLERIVGRDPETGHDIREPVIGEDGKQLLVPILPDEDMRKTWELYERTVRNLLVEQRARAAMLDARGAPPLDDAAFETQIAELAKKALLEMPRAELDALLKQRRIDIAEKSASPNKASETTGTPARSGEPAPGQVSVAATDREQEQGSTPGNGNGDFLDFSKSGNED